jgi:Trk K+ transport system NAD-binding subunit
MKSIIRSFINWDVIFALIGLLSFLLGIYGFLDGVKVDFLTFSKALISTFQLFLLNVSADSIPSNTALIAAFLAPLSTIGTLILVFGKTVRTWIKQTLLLQIKPANYIFIGGGNTASRLAARLPTNKRSKIICIDVSSDCSLELLINQKDINGFMIHGSGLDNLTLSKIDPNRAEIVFISTGDDFRNIEIGRRLLSLVSKQKSGTVKIIIQVEDYHLARNQHFLFQDVTQGYQIIELMSINRMAARAILNQVKPSLTFIKNHQVPHFMIIGCSDLASSLVIHSVQHCVYHEIEPIKITWVGSNAREKLDQIKKRFIAFDDRTEAKNDGLISKLLPIANITAIDTSETELHPDIWKKININHPISNVFIASLNDDLGICAGLRVAGLREITMHEYFMPIVVCQHESNGSKKTSMPDLCFLDPYEIMFSSYDAYPGETFDFFASLINGVYFDLHINEDSSPKNVSQFIKQSKSLWQNEIESGKYVWSSRLAADHISIKIQLLKLLSTIRTDEISIKDVTELTEDKTVLETLGRLEHRRFVIERLIDGWLPIDINNTDQSKNTYTNSKLSYKEQKSKLSLNYTLVPFSELDELDQKKSKIEKPEVEKDYAIVRAIPYLLKCKQSDQLS